MEMIQNYAGAQTGYGMSGMGFSPAMYPQSYLMGRAQPAATSTAMLGNTGGTITTTLSDLASMIVGVVFSVLERMGLMSPQGEMNLQNAGAMTGRAGAAKQPQLNPYGIASDIAGYVNYADGIVDRVNDSGTVVGNALTNLGVDFGGSIGSYLKQGGQFLSGGVGNVLDTVGGYIGDGASWLWDKASSGVSSLWDGATSLFSSIF